MTMAEVVIVGAGSAGCTLARRLADQGVGVLLLEAGPPDTSPAIHDPTRAFELWTSELDWGYQSTEQPGLGGRRVPETRGRVLGGSSSINGTYYARGQRSDYDTWAYLGNDGWGFADVLPAFKRSEDFDGGASEHRGTGGPLPVMSRYDLHPLVSDMLEAAVQSGVPRNPDYNGASPDGVAPIQLNIRDGKRISAARAFLTPAEGNPNLAVLTGCRARRLLIEGGRCIGVEVERDGRVERVLAARELILSAGVFDSPKLLLLSGIGPADDLAPLGIDVTVDLPGVGRNLQDHVFSPLVYSSTRAIPEAVPGIPQFHAHMFWRSRPGLIGPDMQSLFGHMPHYPEGFAGPDAGFTFTSMLNRPAGRGTVRLASADPQAAPLIDPAYGSCQADVDAIVSGLRTLREIGEGPGLAGWRGEELCPGPSVQSLEDLRAYVRATLSTIFHPVGTCKMGIDELAVVDPALRVRGIDGLRIADASVMPFITSANTHAPTVMIAERLAERLTSSTSGSTEANAGSEAGDPALVT